MKTLNLQQQKLSGTLPPEFGAPTAFPNLFALILQQNQLTGAPAGGAAREQLWALAQHAACPGERPAVGGLVPASCLSGGAPAPLLPPAGTIPKSWNAPGTFPRMSLFTAHYNNLTGDLPEPDSWPQLNVM